MDNSIEDICYTALRLCFTEEGAVEHLLKNLDPENLEVFGKGHADIYRAILHFHEKTGLDPIDQTSFQKWLSTETSIVDAIGGSELLGTYIDEINSSTFEGNSRGVAALVRYYANKARQEEKIRELNSLVDVQVEDYTDKVDDILRDISSLNRSEMDPLKTVSDGNEIAARANDLWELPDFLETQFKSLNMAMGYSESSGFCKGAVHAILAQSGAGKSTLAKSLMNYWVDTGKTVLYINYEEAVAHWERVLFTQITKKNVYQAENISELDKKHYTQVFRDKMNEWNGRFLVQHDPETPYFEDMEKWVRDVAHKKKAPDVIIIDTIQSMFLRSGKNLPRWGQYEEMMVRLEKLAKDLHSAVIITAQENTNRMKDKREVVQQSDIGGSIAIAQKSSIAIFITEAKIAAADDAMDEYIMQLQIPKNRITGTTFLADPPLVKYNDAIKTYEEFEVPPIETYGDNVDFTLLENLLAPQ